MAQLSNSYKTDPLPIADSLERWGHAQKDTFQRLRNPTDPEADDTFEASVRSFQRYWRAFLPESHPCDGHLDNDTIELIGRRFCDCPDQGAGTYEVPGFPKTAGAGKGRHWLKNDSGQYYLTWADMGVITSGGVDFRQAMQFTRDDTLRVCSMELAIRTEQKSSNIEAYAWSGDGRGGTLAYHFFPGYGSDPHNSQDIITGHWDRSDTYNQDSTNLTTCHEIGHGLGLEHSQTPNQLMNPFLNTHLGGWQDEDASRLVYLYDEPGINPVPPPDPEDGAVTLSPGLYRVV